MFRIKRTNWGKVQRIVYPCNQFVFLEIILIKGANSSFENNSAKKLDILHFWQNMPNFEYD